jgi:hypothetical protein
MRIMPLLPNCRARKTTTTKAFRLTPSCLISQARTDIAAKQENRDLLNQALGVLPVSLLHRMGFDYRDVRATDTPADVLRRALKRARSRPRYRQANRATIYRELRALRQALRMAEGST